MDDDRLTSLYRTYGPTIYGRCRALLGDDGEAEDATQETFLRVQRHIANVPHEREALFWIYRVATNYCLNEIRDRRLRPRVATEELLHEVAGADTLDNPEGRLLDRDLVRKLVYRTPVKERAVAWLHHVDGFDQLEVASILGISRQTVADRLARFGENARKYLRRSTA